MKSFALSKSSSWEDACCLKISCSVWLASSVPGTSGDSTCLRGLQGKIASNTGGADLGKRVLCLGKEALSLLPSSPSHLLIPHSPPSSRKKKKQPIIWDLIGATWTVQPLFLLFLLSGVILFWPPPPLLLLSRTWCLTPDGKGSEAQIGSVWPLWAVLRRGLPRGLQWKLSLWLGGSLTMNFLPPVSQTRLPPNTGTQTPMGHSDTQWWQLSGLHGWGASPVVRVLAGQVWCAGRSIGLRVRSWGCKLWWLCHLPLAVQLRRTCPQRLPCERCPCSCAVCALSLALLIFLNLSFLVPTMLLIILVTLQVNCEESMK